MITVKNILIEAINLLENKGWTQDAFARDSNGEGINSLDENATCYCTVGAINAAARNIAKQKGMHGYNEMQLEIAEIESRLNAKITIRDIIGDPIPIWNDTEGRTKDEVIEVLKQAVDSIEE